MATRSDDRQRRRLEAVLGQIAEEDLPDLIEQARQEARARVAAILADALTEEMLERVQAQPGQRTKTARSAGERGEASRRGEAPARQAEPQTGGAPRPAADQERPRGAEGLYALCVITAGQTVPADLTGLDGAPLRLITHEDLAAVVFGVPLAEFEEETLREHLQDMAWLEHTARAHERALERMSDETTLIPMRLCTVMRGEEGVREMLMREQRPLRRALDYLQNKSEWGVKVFAGAGQAAPDSSPPPRDGTDYMRRRQDERERRSAHDEQLHEAAMHIHDRLGTAAEEALSNPPQRPEVSGHGGEMLLNGVYLVHDDRLQAFLALVEDLRKEHALLGLEVQPTGPWPAYNFVPGAIGAAW